MSNPVSGSPVSRSGRGPLSSPRAPLLFGALILTTAVICAYGLAIKGGFVWDDDAHVYANPVIIGPLGLREIWTTTAANYFPLVLTNFWVQHALWGLNSAGYHAVTLAFHLCAVVLLWRILLRLQVPGALFAALWWGIHPVQVESVAWVSELKNTQSAVFFLLSIAFFDRWVTATHEAPTPGHLKDSTRSNRSALWYGLAFVTATFAILSKSSTVMLPCALGLVWWWRIRVLPFQKALLALSPFFALSALASGWTVWEQQFHSGAIGSNWNQSLADRAIIAGNAVWFYLGKLVWPSRLAFIYPRWAPDSTSALAYLPLILGVAAGIWAFWRRRTAPSTWVAIAYFGVLLFPVLGLFNVYFFRYSFVGDHFQYLASIGPIVYIVSGATIVLRRYVICAGAVLAGAVGMLTLLHCADFRSPETLWRATIRSNPRASMAWVHLGIIRSNEREYAEAMRYFNHALAIDKNNAEAYNNIGCEYLRRGEIAPAISALKRAIELNPESADGHNNLGFALRENRQVGEAVREYGQAIRLNPDYVDAQNNLGIALVELGQAADAIHHYKAAIALKPREPYLHHNLANAYFSLGRAEDAVREFEAAQALGGSDAELLDDLGRALSAVGRSDEAIHELEAAIRSNPRLGSAYDHLGLCYIATGQLAAASAEFQRAVACEPKSFEFRMNFGRSLTAMGRWKEAREEFAVATSLNPDSAEAFRDLAMACANLAAISDALANFETALRLDPNSAETHEAMAKLLQFLGRTADAEVHAQKAAELHANQVRNTHESSEAGR